MADVGAELYEKISDEINRVSLKDETMTGLFQKMVNGTATHRDTNAYATRLGEITSEVLQKYITPEALPDGTLYYNIAESTVGQVLYDNYGAVSEYGMSVQDILNEDAGLGLKAMQADYNEDRIHDLINSITHCEDFEESVKLMAEPIINTTQSYADDLVRANANFQYECGLSPVIVREAQAGCCKWCASLAGTYDYDKVSDRNNPVFQRHEYCRCIVDYVPRSGKHAGQRQDVWSKQWTDTEENAIMKTRKIVGLKAGDITITGVSDHAMERIKERNIAEGALLDAINNPLKVTSVKHDKKDRPSITVIGSKATLYINPETGVVASVHSTHTNLAKRLSEGGDK